MSLAIPVLGIPTESQVNQLTSIRTLRRQNSPYEGDEFPRAFLNLRMQLRMPVPSTRPCALNESNGPEPIAPDAGDIFGPRHHPHRPRPIYGSGGADVGPSEKKTRSLIQLLRLS